MKKVMAVVAILALLVGNSFAQEKTANKPTKTQKQAEGKKKGVPKIMDEIPNLSKDQQARIQAVSDEAREQTAPQRAQKKELSAKIKELKAAENPNQNELNKLIDKMATVKAELAKSKAATDLKIRNILTPEQRKVYDAKMKEKREKKSSK